MPVYHQGNEVDHAQIAGICKAARRQLIYEEYLATLTANTIFRVSNLVTFIYMAAKHCHPDVPVFFNPEKPETSQSIADAFYDFHEHGTHGREDHDIAELSSNFALISELSTYVDQPPFKKIANYPVSSWQLDVRNPSIPSQAWFPVNRPPRPSMMGKTA